MKKNDLAKRISTPLDIKVVKRAPAAKSANKPASKSGAKKK